MKYIITESQHRRLFEEETSDDKVSVLLKKMETVFNRMEFEAVDHIGFDYNDVMNGFDVNIFFNKRFAIDNPNVFNKVQRETINKIGFRLKKVLPFKYYYYTHFQ